MAFTVRLLPLALIILALSLILGLGALAVGARVYGDEIVYVVNSGMPVTARDVFTLDLGRMLHAPRVFDLGILRGLDTPPAWLPDGSGVVLMVNDIALPRPESDTPLLLETSARNPRALDVDLPRGALTLAFAPDGGRAAYTRINQDGYQTLHVRNLRTGSEAQITADLTNAFTPTWSPDGRSLAFSWSPVANAEIYVVNAAPDRSPVAENPRPRRLTFNYNLDTSPAWSPDGRWIAFVSDRDGNSEIYLMDAARGEAAEDNDGLPIVRLTDDPARNLDPQWSPDGRWISYFTNQQGMNALFMIETRCALRPSPDCTPQTIRLTSGNQNVWVAVWRPR